MPPSTLRRLLVQGDHCRRGYVLGSAATKRRDLAFHFSNLKCPTPSNHDLRVNNQLVDAEQLECSGEVLAQLPLPSHNAAITMHESERRKSIIPIFAVKIGEGLKLAYVRNPFRLPKVCRVPQGAAHLWRPKLLFRDRDAIFGQECAAGREL